MECTLLPMNQSQCRAVVVVWCHCVCVCPLRVQVMSSSDAVGLVWSVLQHNHYFPSPAVAPGLSVLSSMASLSVSGAGGPSATAASSSSSSSSSSTVHRSASTGFLPQIRHASPAVHATDDPQLEACTVVGPLPRSLSVDDAAASAALVRLACPAAPSPCLLCSLSVVVVVVVELCGAPLARRLLSCHSFLRASAHVCVMCVATACLLPPDWHGRWHGGAAGPQRQCRRREDPSPSSRATATARRCGVRGPHR